MDEIESLRAWEFLFASALCSRGSATGGLEGLLLEGLLLLVALDLIVEVGVVERGVEVNVVDVVSGRVATPF